MIDLEGLYRLTSRDEETLLIQPVAIPVEVPWGVGVATVNIGDITGDNWPRDRVFACKGVQVSLAAGAAAARVTQLQLFMGVAPARQLRFLDSSAGILSDGSGTPSNVVARFVQIEQALPAGNRMGFFCTRSDTTAAGTVTLTAWGYLVPPGSIARTL